MNYMSAFAYFISNKEPAIHQQIEMKCVLTDGTVNHTGTDLRDGQMP